jgi:hypothetical protein
LQNYLEIIIISLAIFWNLDYFLAKSQYTSMKPKIEVSLEGKDRIKYQLSHHRIREYMIDLREIKSITLKQREIEKGAFQETVGTIWQMSLIDYDHSIYIIDEAKDLTAILPSAHHLSHELNLPLVFANSEGNNQYADFPLPSNNWRKSNSIQCQKNTQQWHIYSQWQVDNLWRWLQQLFLESGFFFFVLIMSAFMIKFGSWVEFVISVFLGIKFPVLHFYTPQELFSPEISLTDGIELFIGILFMVVTGWKMSQTKHIYINKHFCKFLMGNQHIAQFSTKQIKSILLLNRPQLEVLIFDHQKYFQLQAFLGKEELQEIVYQLELAVNTLTAIRS